MNIHCIPLPEAIPGKEYIIQSIKNGDDSDFSFGGYGIFPGSRIKLLFSSPKRNPAAYEVMGAVLALRREDSSNIYVLPASSCQMT